MRTIIRIIRILFILGGLGFLTATVVSSVDVSTSFNMITDSRTWECSLGPDDETTLCVEASNTPTRGNLPGTADSVLHGIFGVGLLVAAVALTPYTHPPVSTTARKDARSDDRAEVAAAEQ